MFHPTAFATPGRKTWSSAVARVGDVVTAWAQHLLILQDKLPRAKIALYALAVNVVSSTVFLLVCRVLITHLYYDFTACLALFHTLFLALVLEAARALRLFTPAPWSWSLLLPLFFEGLGTGLHALSLSRCTIFYHLAAKLILLPQTVVWQYFLSNCRPPLQLCLPLLLIPIGFVYCGVFEPPPIYNMTNWFLVLDERHGLAFFGSLSLALGRLLGDMTCQDLAISPIQRAHLSHFRVLPVLALVAYLFDRVFPPYLRPRSQLAFTEYEYSAVSVLLLILSFLAIAALHFSSLLLESCPAQHLPRRLLHRSGSLKTALALVLCVLAAEPRYTGSMIVGLVIAMLGVLVYYELADRTLDSCGSVSASATSCSAAVGASTASSPASSATPSTCSLSALATPGSSLSPPSALPLAPPHTSHLPSTLDRTLRGGSAAPSRAPLPLSDAETDAEATDRGLPILSIHTGLLRSAHAHAPKMGLAPLATVL